MPQFGSQPRGFPDTAATADDVDAKHDPSNVATASPSPSPGVRRGAASGRPTAQHGKSLRPSEGKSKVPARPEKTKLT